MVIMAIDTEEKNPTIIHLAIDEIAEALDNCTYDTRYILDLRDQEIIRLSEYDMATDDIEDFFEEIDDDETGRYVLFPIRINSMDAYEDMQRFTDDIEEPQTRELIDQSIRGAGAFRRFKDIISEYPDLEGRWYVWKDEQARLRAGKWLDEEGLILMKND